MIEPIERYSVVAFDSLAEHATFMMQLLHFIGSREGLKYLAGEPRAVVWSMGPFQMGRRGGQRLFLSAGAVEAAREAGLRAEMTDEVTNDDLPADRALLVGDQRDWHL